MAGHEIERAADSLEGLYRSGDISRATTEALMRVDGAALAIGRGLGSDAGASEQLLATILVDDSPSVERYVAEMRAGHETMLATLASQESTAQVQALTRTLNRGVLTPYRPLADAAVLTSANFNERTLLPSTPLYHQSLLTLGTVLAKAYEQEQRGTRVRTFTLLLTDGADNASGDITAMHVKAMVTDMLEFSSNHIVAGMGVGTAANWQSVFGAMGIPDRWIFRADASAEEVRAIFERIAALLALAASSETAFGQLVAGSDAA